MYPISSTAIIRQRSEVTSADRHRRAQRGDWPILLVEKPRAEALPPPRVDNRAADHVAPLVQRQPLRDAIVDHGLAIVVERSRFLAIDPPHRRGVRADRQAPAAH